MKWISVPEYAELKKKTAAWAYLQIQLGRLKTRKVRSKELVLEVAVDNSEKKA